MALAVFRCVFAVVAYRLVSLIGNRCVDAFADDQEITVTLYSGGTSMLTSQATLGPVTMNPGTGRTCHYDGYWVSAELRSDDTLDYHRLV